MPNLRLRAEFSVVLSLMIGGAVTAQTQTAASSVSTTTAPNATSTEELKSQKGPSAAPEDGAEARNRFRARTVPNGPKLFEETSESSVKESGPMSSPQSTTEDDWHFRFTPYFWLASLHGNAGVGSIPVRVDERFGDIFHVLDFVFMATFEARKGKLMSLTDLEYVSVSDEKATPGPLFSTATAKFKIFIFDPEVGYRVYDNPEKEAFVDVLGGVRVSRVSTNLIFNPGILAGFELQGSRTWVDGVGGLRFKAAVSRNAFVTGKGDLGGGGSKFTYHLFGGVGYNLSKKIGLIGGYRVLKIDYDKNGFRYDMNQRGPIVGIGFKF